MELRFFRIDSGENMFQEVVPKSDIVWNAVEFWELNRGAPGNGTLFRRVEHLPLFSGCFPPASPVSPTMLSSKSPHLIARIPNLPQYISVVPRPSQTPLGKEEKKTTITSLESLPSPRGTASASALLGICK